MYDDIDIDEFAQTFCRDYYDDEYTCRVYDAYEIFMYATTCDCDDAFDEYVDVLHARRDLFNAQRRSFDDIIHHAFDY